MSQPIKSDDPAIRLLKDDFISIPTVFRKGCYICEDPEYARMGLPLCRSCPKCGHRGGGHIPADDSICDECGYDEEHESEQ
jgi:hypothetical protein